MCKQQPPCGDLRSRGLMIVQHAMWYLQICVFKKSMTQGDEQAVDLLDEIALSFYAQ